VHVQTTARRATIERIGVSAKARNISHRDYAERACAAMLREGVGRSRGPAGPRRYERNPGLPKKSLAVSDGTESGRFVLVLAKIPQPR
jgi:hypothetical protein